MNKFASLIILNYFDYFIQKIFFYTNTYATCVTLCLCLVTKMWLIFNNKPVLRENGIIKSYLLERTLLTFLIHPKTKVIERDLNVVYFDLIQLL